MCQSFFEKINNPHIIDCLTCIQKIHTYLQVKKLLYIFIYFFIANCAFSQKSWIAENDEKVVKFYPNPATSFITFDVQKPVEKGYIMYIYNFLGRKVLTVALSTNKVTIPLDNFFRGVYIFQVVARESGNIVESNKFQVTK